MAAQPEVITVAGSTGTTGRELVRLLSEAGAATRALLRDAGKARPLPHVAWTIVDLRETTTLEPALVGTSRLFLLTGNDPEFGRVQTGVIRAAASLGIEHVVKLSALGASDHSHSAIGREHWRVEQELLRAGMKWTILRPHSFMQNWLADLADAVRNDGAVYSPIGEGRVPFIDARDIAEVAAKILLDPEPHAGRKYVLTGGEAVGYAEVAAALADATGKAVAYRPISMQAARDRLEARGIPTELIDAQLALAAYQKAGGPTAKVFPDTAQLLGRPPRTIRDFARDHAAFFRS